MRPSDPRTRIVTLRGNRNQADARHSPRMVNSRYFRGIRLREGGGGLRGTYKVNCALSLRQRKSGIVSVATKLLDERSDTLEARGVSKTTNQLDGYSFAIP